MTLKVVLW